jgi:hypothetical protein
MDLKKRIIELGLLGLLLSPLSLLAQNGFSSRVDIEMPESVTPAIIAGSSLYFYAPEPSQSGIAAGFGAVIHHRSQREVVCDLEQTIPLSRPIGKSGLRITKSWAWVSSAVALAAGAAGYYFKYKADRSYDKYLDTIVPEQMDSHFNDSLKFDKLSTACYVSGEVLLVFSLVIFIKTVRTE